MLRMLQRKLLKVIYFLVHCWLLVIANAALDAARIITTAVSWLPAGGITTRQKSVADVR